LNETSGQLYEESENQEGRTESVAKGRDGQTKETGRRGRKVPRRSGNLNQTRDGWEGSLKRGSEAHAP